MFFEDVNPEDSVGLEISTVTEEYNQFVTGISNIANQSGNPFDMSGPPANAVGNIQGGDAVGYFRVSAASKKSAKIIDMRMEEGLKTK